MPQSLTTLSTSEMLIKKSRFIGCVQPVADRATAQQVVALRAQHPAAVYVDLAALYGVETKRLNEQVKRNRERFPADFLFQLTSAEKAEVVANCDHPRSSNFPRRCLMRLPSMGRFRRPTCWRPPRRPIGFLPLGKEKDPAADAIEANVKARRSKRT